MPPVLPLPFARRGIAAFVLVALAAAPAAAQLVERVVDGDTIIVHGIGRVRLIGVDTPETVHPNRPVEFFGKEASAFTRKLVKGKRVRLEYDQDRKDRYGRTLAYVYLEDGTFVNAEIIGRGYGHAYTQFPFRHLERFRQLERTARTNRRGLWGTAVGGRSTEPADGAGTSGKEHQPPPGVPAVVYVTRTGTKYHIEGCRYLSKSKRAIKRNEAVERYQLCGVCAKRLRSEQ